MQRPVKHLLWIATPLLLGAPLLTALAQTTSSAALPALTFSTPDPAKGAQIATNCQKCHGPGNISPELDTPSLAGQQASYLRRQLTAFRARQRLNTDMQQVSARLSDQDIADVAAHLATLAPGPAWKVEDATVRSKGEQLYAQGDPARNLIACVACHGPTGHGDDELGMASLTNLAPVYTTQTLKHYRDSAKFSSTHGEAMRIAIKPLTDDDINALSVYLSSMK